GVGKREILHRHPSRAGERRVAEAPQYSSGHGQEWSRQAEAEANGNPHGSVEQVVFPALTSRPAVARVHGEEPAPSIPIEPVRQPTTMRRRPAGTSATGDEHTGSSTHRTAPSDDTMPKRPPVRANAT